jgi:hypothetical protein
VRDQNELTAYQVPIVRDLDTTLVPTFSLNHVWRNAAGVSWQPLGMLTLSADLSSSRDLRHYDDSTEIGRLASLSRRSFLGMDVGVERDRQLSSSATLTPVISSWLRPRFIHRSGFTLSRYLTSRPPIQVGGDTVGAFVLPQTLNNSRSDEIGASLDIGRLIQGVVGDSSGINKVFARMRPVDASSRRVLSSSFDLAAFDPTLSYQFALGGLGDFLQQYGTRAIGASDLTVRTVTSGADLPLGVSFALSYSKTDAPRYQRFTDVTHPLVSRQTEWPAGNVRWSQTFTGGPITLLALGTTFRRRTGLSEQPAGDASTARSATTSTSLSPDLQLGFRNGMNVSASMSSVNQRDDRNGTSTLLDQSNFLATLSYSFRLPAPFGRSRKRVNSSLQARTDHSTTCLISQDETECVQVSDTKNQALSAQFSTDLGNLLTGAFEFGYLLNAAEHLNRRLSTIYMTVSFRLALYAGDLR